MVKAEDTSHIDSQSGRSVLDESKLDTSILELRL